MAYDCPKLLDIVVKITSLFGRAFFQDLGG
jgi:hypothetical protein